MEKRKSGQVENGKWLVLTESKGKSGVGFTHKCGEPILGVRVAHPVWDGPFKCSGGGECRYETVPYCPKCETEPNQHGEPIDVPFPGLARKL